jgi:hypothetical protein
VTSEKARRVCLICQCGMPYKLNTIYDLRSQCVNERCRATLNMNTDQLWKYQESLITLMGVLGLGRDYRRELDIVRRISKKFVSPYTIDVIEIP